MVENGLADILGKAAEIKQDVFERIWDLTEVWHLRRNKAISLRDKQIVGDFPFYLIWKNEVRLCVAPKEYNLIFKNLRRACNGLLQTRNYQPDKEGIDILVDSIKKGYTFSVKCSRLRFVLDERRPQFAYLPINTSTYNNSLNEYELAVGRRFYEKEDFEKNMKWMNEEGIIETRVGLLNPDYVKSQITDGQAIACLCVASGLYYNYWVYANNAGVVFLVNYLHRIQNAIQRPSMDHLRECLTLCLNNPVTTARIMKEDDYRRMLSVLKHYDLDIK